MAKVDRSGHEIWMDLVHALVHAESAFSVVHEVPSTAAGQNYDIRIRVGARRHHSYGATITLTSGSARLSLIEAPSNSGTGGSALTPVNRWRGSSATATTQLTAGVTGVNVTGATANIGLGRIVVPSNGPPSTRNPTQQFNNAEWTLKPNTDYILRLASIATFEADVAFLFYDIGS